MPVARVHNVAVFAEPETPGFKACLYFYYATKVHKAKAIFHKEYPDRKIIKIVGLGMQDVEFSQEKYRALYQDA